MLRSEVRYNEAERAWFGAAEGPRRCVVRFEDYVRDLPGARERIYAARMDGPPGPHVPAAHPPRRRHACAVDRSLAQLGIDATALDARLADYRAWTRAGAGPAPR